MRDFNGHHTLWGCNDVNNRGQQLEDLILKNYNCIYLSHTYFHSASGTFTSIDLTLCSPSLFLDFSWKVGNDPCVSDQFPIVLENDELKYASASEFIIFTDSLFCLEALLYMKLENMKVCIFKYCQCWY